MAVIRKVQKNFPNLVLTRSTRRNHCHKLMYLVPITNMVRYAHDKYFEIVCLLCIWRLPDISGEAAEDTTLKVWKFAQDVT